MPGGNPNPFPTPENLRPAWKKGESGNPGGLTREQRARQLANAEAATRARTRLIDALNRRLEDLETEPAGLTVAMISGDILRLLKDNEDRGFGSATQKVDLGGPGGHLGQVDLSKLDDATLVRLLEAAYPGGKGPLLDVTPES